jgi:hypothetical protein
VATMHIEILAHKSTGYEVRVVGPDGHTIRTFAYRTIEAARRAARAWTGAYGDCPVVDRSGEKE